MPERRYLSGPVYYLLAALALVGSWWGLSLGLHMAAFPDPARTVAAFMHSWAQGLGSHTAVSARRVVLSLLLAVFSAVPAGLGLGQTKRADRVLSPVIYLTYPVPKSVFLPVVMAVLGLGDTARVFLVWSVVFFQVLVAIRDASRSVSPQFLYSIRSLGATRWDVFRHVVWPAVLPEVFTSLRVALGTAIAVLFLAETWASDSGIGYFIMLAWSRLAWDDMMAGVLAMGSLGMALYLLLDLLERRICRWRYL
ncbi:MAG TPA: ABC transporter permease [Firmicutes bacterium]|nr:ABC transporter permease [Bacillota bacterium]